MPPAIDEQRNVSLAGYHDLNGRSGLKLAMQEVDGRWLLYTGHVWEPGWSVLDVTDPEAPTLETTIDGPDNTWCHQVQVADGLMLTGLDKPREGWQPVGGEGYDPDGEFTEGVFVWDVGTDPTDPDLLAHYETGGEGTHRNHYDGGDYAYLAARPDGYDGYHNYRLTTLDVSDPTDPQAVGAWWAEGQAAGETPSTATSFVSTAGPLAASYFHGPAYPDPDRELAYLSYGRLGMVILDVSDPADPTFVSRTDFGALGSCLGTHSVVPIPDSELVAVNSEAILEGSADALNYVLLVDVSDPEQPQVASMLPRPDPEPSVPHDNYYEKGGRFGPHNQHHYQYQDCLWRPTEYLFVTYFNAGLRVFDVSDPLAPTEAGYFVPEAPDERTGSLPTELVTQFEDVLVDARGYAYCTDKNHGLTVLEPELL